MALLNKLASAGEMSGSILKKMFTGLFDGDKKRTIASSRTTEPLKENATEMEAFAHAVKETNEILTDSVQLQKDQNVTLNEILELLKNYKPGKGINDKSTFNLKDLLPDFSSKDKSNVKPTAKPSATRRFNPTGIKAGIGGILGGVALDYAGGKLADAGHEKLAAGTDIASSALSGAGTGAMLGSFIPVVGTGIGGIIGGAIGGAYGLYQNWSNLFGEDKPKEEAGVKETSARILEFNARDIKITAKDMLIRADEIKVNGEIQQTSTPAGPSGGATPSVLGSTPTTPGATSNGASGPGGLTTVTSKSGPSTKVGATYAPNFQSFIDDLEATGYKISSLGGYANRANANNPNVKSYHAMGAAIDINPASNPNRSTKTDLPQETGALAAKHGLGWGMNWRSVKDPMHFSAAKSEQGSFDVQRGSMTGYASGTDYVPESGPAIVGEKGPELVMGKDGSTRITGDGPRIEHLHKGDSVLPADKTKKLTGYADGTTNAEKEVRQRGGHKVERSGSYMSRPHFYDTQDKFYAALGERKAGTEVDGREAYEVEEAFQRGKLPSKPDSMTTKEYQGRMKEYGTKGLISGAISPDVWEKNAKRADQPLWVDKAQDKAVSFSRAAAMQQPQVKPLIAPPPPEVKPSSRDDWAKGAQSGGMDWDLQTLDQARQPEMAGASLSAGMGAASGDLLKAYLTSGQ